jgi:hypothetical protein
MLMKGSKIPRIELNAVHLYQHYSLFMAYWLRRCATNRTVPGLIPRGVSGFFSDIFLSDRTMALRSTQLTTAPHSCAEYHEIWEPKPPGTLWATPGL